MSKQKQILEQEIASLSKRLRALNKNDEKHNQKIIENIESFLKTSVLKRKLTIEVKIDFIPRLENQPSLWVDYSYRVCDSKSLDFDNHVLSEEVASMVGLCNPLLVKQERDKVNKFVEQIKKENPNLADDELYELWEEAAENII